jgi:riboflavin kinase/FMN adenylyltransferase
MAQFLLRWSEYAPSHLHGGAVTIGNFDGVHRGHGELVRTAQQLASRVGGQTLAITFDPPPVQLLNPTATKLPLSTLEDRVQALHEAGADHVIVLATDASLLALSAEAYFEDVLVRQLGIRAIAEGYNFCFGRGREGNTDTLRALCQQAGVLFEEVPPFVLGAEPVSSSRVRATLLAGDVATAAELLGRPYAIQGTVVRGAQRGRTIGVPTANLGAVATLTPAVGVYAAWATVQGQRYRAAANIGPNPTFGDEARKIEIHLLDFTGDLYDQSLRVAFTARLRDTRPFPDVTALIQQLQHDIATVRQML